MSMFHAKAAPSACTVTSTVIMRMSELDDYETRSHRIVISGNTESCAWHKRILISLSYDSCVMMQNF